MLLTAGFVLLTIGVAGYFQLKRWPGFSHRDAPSRHMDKTETLQPPRIPRTIALANRTLCATGFPVRFCERQTASVRGTAPYVVALAPAASKPEAIAAVRACGGRVIGPLPPEALLVETSIFALGKMSVDPHFAAAAEWLPEDKVDPRLTARLGKAGDTLDVTVVALAPADVDRLVDEVVSHGGVRLTGCLDGKSTVTLTMPKTLIEALAKRGDVRWLEPFARPRILNDQAVGPTAMNVRPIWETYGLTGRGQLITTSDTGIDTGNLATMHADLKNRVIGFGVSDNSYTYDANGHGTHTAGSIVGDGTRSDGQIRGTAYDAQLWAWFCNGTDGYLYMPTDCGELFRPAGRADNAFIHSASWGDENGDGSYSSQCESIDDYVWNHPEFLPVFANGNDGTKGATTVGAPATAKNVLAVGATQNDRTTGDGGWGNGDPAQIARFSSRGPCTDGRIKPDLAAPGVGILSTRSYAASYAYGVDSNTNYAYSSGTSMATPLTAGAAALVRQWLVERRGFTNAVPTAALVKAVLTGGAKDVCVPDNNFGWGRVDLGESLYPSNRTVRLFDRIPFGAKSEATFQITLTNAAPFDAQLVWIDYPATAGANRTLINDLDLVVSNQTTGAVWFGNGTPDGDRTNTVESVRLPMAEPGSYTVFVRGHDVSYASTQGGAAALYLRGAFEGEVEPVVEKLEIVSAQPADTQVSLHVGSTNAFVVALESSTNFSPVCSWQLDGVTQSATTTNFIFGSTWADHGTHQLVFTATAPSGLMAMRVWTLSVWAEVRVDSATGDDGTATGETNHPYATMTAALAQSAAGDILHVGPGTYAGIVLTVPDMHIISDAGPETTILDGGGTNRCFDASSSLTSILSGFTLTNGWVSTDIGDGYGAGALYGTLTNCVIRDCRAEGSDGRGGGAAGATLVDCIVENCCGDWQGGGLYGCTASFCLIANNENYYSNAYAGGAGASVLNHCTVFGNVSGESAGGVDGDTSCTNSIIWGNELFNGETSNWEMYFDYATFSVKSTALTSCCTTPNGYTDGGGNTNEAPRWVDAPAGDFRLAVHSPCLASANDALNMGVWQGDAVPGYILTATVDGPGAVDPETVFVIEGQSATFTATTHHPFFGWSTNAVAAADAATNVFVWSDVRADGTITASFGSTNFFVDAQHGDDAATGWTWAEAKRSIQAAVDVAGAGETVSVNPGTYGGIEVTASRLDIVAVEGPDVTILDGGATNRCYDGYANQATLLRGFTLFNGASTNNYGGGVLYGTLSNCVIRNCTAKLGGGGACDATLTDCVIAGCTAGTQGGGAFGCTLVNCTVRGNAAGAWRNDYSRAYGFDCGGGVDCQCVTTNTIVWGNRRTDGTSDNWERYLYPYRGYLFQTAADFYWSCTSPTPLFGTNTITNDPLFASETVSNPELYEISPCLKAGCDGVNIGAYCGTGVVKALPEIDVATATGEDIAAAVASVGYADASVVTGIGSNAETYAAFQAWSTNGLKSTAVVFSSRAYDSFLVRDIVAAPTLLADGQESKLELTALTPASDGKTCSTTVTLTDGDTVIPLQAAKEAFAALTKLGDDVANLNPANAKDITATPAADKKSVTLTIEPPANTSRYFINISVH